MVRPKTRLNRSKNHPSGPRAGLRGRNSIAESAGLNVSALIAERMTEIETGDRELLIQAAGDARNERGRHEDRREHERDADDRAGDFLHRAQRRVARRQAVLDVMLDRLDHDDRIIDDETDREHETEERERIDAKAEKRKEHERANERHGHGAERDQGRAPALQEEKDHNDHEHERLDERLDDLVDAGGDGARRVERDV